MWHAQDTVPMKQKKHPVLYIAGFFFRMGTQVKAEMRSELTQLFRFMCILNGRYDGVIWIHI